MRWLVGQSGNQPWRLVLGMCLSNGGYISLPLPIFVLDKKGGRKFCLPDSRESQINMHVNERLFGRGIVDVGNKNSTT